MVKIEIDGKQYEVSAGSTILQACNTIGIEIPKFCYHERLAIAGNCRMCLVQIAQQKKPIASCTFPITANLEIFTSTPLIKKLRSSVLEFLLANHPLDCPICDQAGECDLQEQTRIYGNDRGRYFETKRSVEYKYCNSFVKAIMTRCIHCTRCVRFATQIAGFENFGLYGRGNKLQIGTYIEKVFNNELSGNLIDLCPVGALTSKPYSFLARPWEYKSVKSIDIYDAVGSNIRIDYRGFSILRIVPRINRNLNQEWITDKVRFGFDALYLQRITCPSWTVSNSISTRISWFRMLSNIATHLKGKTNESENLTIKGVLGELTELESAVLLKDLIYKNGSYDYFYKNSSQLSNVNLDQRLNYIFNLRLNGIQKSTCFILLGSNPRFEAPLLNIRLRQNLLLSNKTICSILIRQNLNYNFEQISNQTDQLVNLITARLPFSNQFIQMNYPCFILGMGLFKRDDINTYISKIQTILTFLDSPANNIYSMFNVIQTKVGELHYQELGGSSTLGTF